MLKVKDKDHFALWVISGVIGDLVRNFVALIFILFGVFKTGLVHVAADIFLKPKDIHTFWGTVIGLFVDLLIGASLGILIGLLIRKTGTKNYILKGLGVSWGAWLFLFGVIFHNLPGVETLSSGPGENPFLVILAIISHGIFGVVTAWTYVKIAKLGSSGGN